MHGFSILTAIVALSTLSISSARPSPGNSLGRHSNVGNHVRTVDAVLGVLNSVLPRKDDDGTNVPTVGTVPGNLNSVIVIARAGGDGAVDNIPTLPATPDDLATLNTRAGGDPVSGNVHRVGIIPGHLNSVVARDGEDEPECDSDDSGSSDGGNAQ